MWVTIQNFIEKGAPRYLICYNQFVQKQSQKNLNKNFFPEATDSTLK